MAERLRSIDPHDRSLGELFGDLSNDFSRLVRNEIELAKVEMTDKAKGYGVAAGFLGGAAIAGLLMLGSLTAMLILVLAEVMDAWLAALIVTLLWLATGVVLALVGRSRLEALRTPIPEQTIETVKEDIRWAKNPTRSVPK